jgi:hypothetical protein
MSDVNLNPHAKAYLKAMKGWPLFHYCTYGERLIAVNVFGVRIDLYKSRLQRPLYGRIRNAGALFLPYIGSITWPLPDRFPDRPPNLTRTTDTQQERA